MQHFATAIPSVHGLIVCKQDTASIASMDKSAVHKGKSMHRLLLSALLLQLTAAGAHGATTSLYSDLYGTACKTIDFDKNSGARTRRCAGVAGYRLLVHEANGQTSIDIVTPRGAVHPLEYWEVLAPGVARVGRKAEWRLEQRAGKLVPTALLVRLDTAEQPQRGPRFASAGGVITAARIESDGACVVYQGNGALRSADTAARNAAAGRRYKCLGAYAGN